MDEVHQAVKNVKDQIDVTKITPRPLSWTEVVKKKKTLVNEKKEEKNCVIEEQHLLFVKGVEFSQFKNSLNFKEKLFAKFPKRSITKCFFKRNGIINIEFNNVQDLNYVQENWNSFDDFPNSSVINLNQLKNKNNFCNIIIRDVPLNLTDAEILNDLKLNCEKLQSVQRFIKKGKPLPIVKLTFKDESNINEIINSGIYINNMFFQPEILTEVRKPSRCFNC